MSQTVKVLADFMAMLMIIVIAGLTLVSIAAVWKFIDIRDVLYKSVFSFSILATAYIIIVIAGRYWGQAPGANTLGDDNQNVIDRT